MKISLKTDRLQLRQIDSSTDDLTNYLKWLRDVESNPFIQSARADFTLKELINFIDEVNSNNEAILLGIFLKRGTRMIGTLKIQPIKLSESTAWIGILIGDTNYRGKGLAKEALQVTLEFLFKTFNLKEIFLGVNHKNYTAISLYRGLGFVDYIVEEDRLILIKTNFANL